MPLDGCGGRAFFFWTAGFVVVLGGGRTAGAFWGLLAPNPLASAGAALDRPCGPPMGGIRKIKSSALGTFWGDCFFYFEGRVCWGFWVESTAGMFYFRGEGNLNKKIKKEKAVPFDAGGTAFLLF